MIGGNTATVSIEFHLFGEIFCLILGILLKRSAVSIGQDSILLHFDAVSHGDMINSAISVTI